MSSRTTNLGLEKVTSDQTIGDLQESMNGSGGNMDIIDTKMGPVGNTSLQAQVDALNSKLARVIESVNLNSKFTNVDINQIVITGKVATVNIRAQATTAVGGNETLFDLGTHKFGAGYAFLFDISENRYGNSGNSRIFGYDNAAGSTEFYTGAIPVNYWVHFFATFILL